MKTAPNIAPFSKSAGFLNGLALSALSGLLLGLAWRAPEFHLVWIALIPLVIATNQAESLRKVALLTTVAGLLSGIIQYWWMYATFERFTATESAFALVLPLLFALLSCFWLLLVFGSFHFLALKDRIRTTGRLVFRNALIFGLIYFLADFIRVHTFPGFVWDKLTLVSYLGAGTYTLQLAPLTGALGVAILIAGVNYLAAEAIASSNFRTGLIAATLFLANLGYGWAVVEAGGGHRSASAGPKVAIVSGNVAAETKWAEQGNAIISRMLGLIVTANEEQPDLVVWPETALPWTYLEDDEILHEIAGISGQHQTQHLIGYLSESDRENQVYNSAYLIDADASAIGRYDKLRLLDFMEKAFPLGGFLQSGANTQWEPMIPGNGSPALSASAGMLQVMICNESLLPQYFGGPASGTEFLVNMSNNAWFDQSPELLDMHFNHAIHRALEYRKDVVVSSNRGVSGFINRYGIAEKAGPSERPELILSHITPHTNQTPFARFPLLIPLLSTITLATLLFKKIYS